MNLTKYLPSSDKLAQETVATLAAILISAWIISQFPALKKLVKDNNT